MRLFAPMRQFCFCLFLCFALFTPVAAQTVTQTPEQWRADLRYLAQELPRRHVNPFRVLPADTWVAEVARIDDEIPDLPDHVIILRMVQLVALIGDAHTSLNRSSPLFPFRVYPIGFTDRPDGAYVTRVVANQQRTMRGLASNQRLIGARLLAINGVPLDEIKQRMLRLIATDNEYWPNYLYGGMMNVAEILHALGIVADMTQCVYMLQLSDQSLTQLVLPPMTNAEFAQTVFASWTYLLRTGQLFVLQRSNENYWSVPLPERQALYFRYSRCAEMPTKSFASFTQELLAAMNDSNVQRLIVDLRGNPGGNSAIITPFFNALLRHRLNQRGQLFVLIDNGTHSSGMWAANDFQLRTQAILIGEPTAGKPNSPGEVLTFSLPFSGLTANCSTKLHNQRPGETLAAIFPNVFVQFPWSALAAGRDPVLEAALNY